MTPFGTFQRGRLFGGLGLLAHRALSCALGFFLIMAVLLNQVLPALHSHEHGDGHHHHHHHDQAPEHPADLGHEDAPRNECPSGDTSSDQSSCPDSKCLCGCLCQAKYAPPPSNLEPLRGTVAPETRRVPHGEMPLDGPVLGIDQPPKLPNTTR